MRNYCTLFDSKYLPQGLVLYASLLKHSSEPFTLYVLAMDEECCEFLYQLNIAQMKLTKINWLIEENPKLLQLREQRTWQEFCWGMASYWSEWLINQGLPEITYLDADMMFFSDPKVIFDEIGDRSIAVIPHRLIPSKKHLEVNGKFNVSWVTFKNNPIGRECLSTWAAQCREKCSAMDGCGDQKYLDAWPDKYGHELCVIQNIGAGLAPWNLAHYPIDDGERFDKTITVWSNHHSRGGAGWEDVVFYHYHEFKERIDGTFQLTNYELRNADIDLIYKPYVAAYKSAKERIASVHLSA